VDAPGAVVVEAEGAGVVVVSGAFWVVGTEVVVVGVCDVVGAVVVELGDCANAAVAKTRPTAVLMRKRVFISGFSCLGLHGTSGGASWFQSGISGNL
jgi:hypothetical protein